MKAAIINAYGTKLEITDIAKPALLADSVMIEVHASGANPVDNLIRPGYRSYALDQVREAFDYSQSGRVKGKIVITVK